MKFNHNNEEGYFQFWSEIPKAQKIEAGIEAPLLSLTTSRFLKQLTFADMQNQFFSPQQNEQEMQVDQSINVCNL